MLYNVVCLSYKHKTIHYYNYTLVNMATMICRDYQRGSCSRSECKFPHQEVCLHYWRHGSCKFGETCRFPHVKQEQQQQQKHSRNDRRRPKNTETFEPLTKPVEMRVVCDVSHDNLTISITTRDVLLAPNLFNDFRNGAIYNMLMKEISSCSVPTNELMKLWHGDCHYIADDHTPWKQQAPTFKMVVDRIRNYFNMDIKATRFNYYKDTSQWKAFHHDAAAVKQDKAATQNFTVAVSFGATRDVAFEEVKSKCVISMPQPDGWTYCFSRDTNVLWKHGILKEKEVRDEGRISIICWGWFDDMIEV